MTNVSEAIDTRRHPCFAKEAKGKYGRVHLPVAPKCNVQCNFCDRKYDCINESRPGVCSAVLSPQQARLYLDNVLDNDPRITVVGLAGPGDPFANPEETLETLRLIREKYPELILCVSSNGLQVAEHVAELAALKVSHLTITVNAVDPEIGAKIYAWVRYGKKVYRGVAGAALLWERQQDAIGRLKEHGIIVKINSIFMQDVNHLHLPEIARVTAALGADIQNIIPLLPVSNTPFASLPIPEPTDLAEARDGCSVHLHQMRHCARCRADAVGLLGESNNEECARLLAEAAASPLHPLDDRPFVAVASHEGALVNQHLGEAREIWIYEPGEHHPRLREQRPAPPVGGGLDRWNDLADRLSDCFALLVSGIGPRPEEVLTRRGIRVITMEGLIETAVDDMYAGRPIKAPVRQFKCGAACSGGGGGCG